MAKERLKAALESAKESTVAGTRSDVRASPAQDPRSRARVLAVAEADTIPAMRTVYISPHLDDAVLSTGGLIHDQVQAGQQVEIWTMMCGYPEPQELSPAAAELHAKWGTTTIPQTVSLRRKEDTRAASMLGATAVHFDFPDAIYRRDSEGAALYGELVAAPVHAADANLPSAIAQALRSRLRPDDTVTCQLAVGRHVDHVLVRQAAEVLGRPLLYALDIPYVLDHPDDLPPKTAGLESRLMPVSEKGLEVWLEAVAAYASQLSSLYESWETLQRDMRLAWERERGIRLWCRPSGRRPVTPSRDSTPHLGAGGT